MKKSIAALLAILLYCYLVILPSPSVFAQEPSSPTPSCSCTPGTVLFDCYTTIPAGWCQDSNFSETYGRGKKSTCNPDCQTWKEEESCFPNCPPPQPQITPVHYSLEKSVGDFNEYLEKGIHSGTRPTGVPIDVSDPNNYGAVAALAPAGGPNHELRVEFVKKWGKYDVVLDDGTVKKAVDIWNECTQNGDLKNWQAYQEKLEKCPDWGFVPLTYRRVATGLAATSQPTAKTKGTYFKEKESPFILSWKIFAPVEWIFRFFRNIFCAIDLFCPADPSLPLRNPDNASGWTAGKPNVPQEAVENAELLRQFLLPKGIPLGNLPQGKDSYFETPFEETGQAAQLSSAEGGLFRIFQPQGITPRPALCQEDQFNPEGGCASDFYFKLANASPNTCSSGNLCYTDTPDQKTFASSRPTDDRPLLLRTWMNFFKQSLSPFGQAASAPSGTGGNILDFVIPYRDTTVRAINPEQIRALVKSSWPESKISELWETVVERSIAAGVNPAFALTIWIEESGASGVAANSPFGCFPGGDTSQIIPFEESLSCFLNFTANEHPSNFEEWVKYFCGPEVEPICANNPGFIYRMKDWYLQLVPAGSPGALTPK